MVDQAEPTAEELYERICEWDRLLARVKARREAEDQATAHFALTNGEYREGELGWQPLAPEA